MLNSSLQCFEHRKYRIAKYLALSLPQDSKTRSWRHYHYRNNGQTMYKQTIFPLDCYRSDSQELFCKTESKLSLCSPEIVFLLLIAGLWWQGMAKETQLGSLQVKRSCLRSSSGPCCSIQSSQLPVAVRAFPLRLPSAAVPDLKVTHKLCSEEKGSKAAPAPLCLLYIGCESEREGGGWRFPELHVTVPQHWWKERGHRARGGDQKAQAGKIYS